MAQSVKAGGERCVRTNLLRSLLKALCVWLAAASMAHAGLIRDAEIEATLKHMAAPIFIEAGIPPKNMHIYIISNPTLNAFVAGGLNMFFHTGLLKATTDPSMLVGVIAHETGHIAGAHLSQFSQTASRATMGGIIGAVIGVAAAAAGGGQAGAGIIAGSQNMALRNLYSGIRVKEQSADHAALTYLDALDFSASGMMEMFELLRRNERGVQRDPYLQTHPLSQQRVATIRNHIEASTIPKGALPPEFTELHARMIAKLFAFTEPYEDTMRRYPESDTSVAARYARAIANFRSNKLDDARIGMEGLLKDHPNDPYFHDTLGQILFENGKVEAAITEYESAHELAKNAPLITTDLAKALLVRGNEGDIKTAKTLLEESIELDSNHGFTWRQLAIAYGRDGELGKSYMAIANEFALEGKYEDVVQQVKRAKPLLKGDEAALLAADDLSRDAKEQIRKREEAESIF